jgi:hypothetical protein
MALMVGSLSKGNLYAGKLFERTFGVAPLKQFLDGAGGLALAEHILKLRANKKLKARQREEDAFMLVAIH